MTDNDIDLRSEVLGLPDGVLRELSAFIAFCDRHGSMVAYMAATFTKAAPDQPSANEIEMAVRLGGLLTALSAGRGL